MTHATRQPLLSEVPIKAGAGLPGAAAISWGAVMTPVGMPTAVVARLDAALKMALTSEAVCARLVQAGADPISPSLASVADRTAGKTALRAGAVREANITVN